MNHLAYVILIRWQNQDRADGFTMVEHFSAAEIAALHELEPLLPLPVTDLAAMLAQTTSSGWVLTVMSPTIVESH